MAGIRTKTSKNQDKINYYNYNSNKKRAMETTFADLVKRLRITVQSVFEGSRASDYAGVSFTS